MSASKEKGTQKNVEQITIDTPAKQWMKHVAAYVVLLIVAMLYFKPVAFDGKSLRQHDNVQAMAMQTEITKYRAVDGETIKWSNHFFGGMPTAILQTPNKNQISSKIIAPLQLFQPYNEWITLFLIVLSCYIGLSLLGVNWALSIALAVILGFFTANTLYISAGHTGKMVTLASIPVILGAFIYAYKKNVLLGGIIFAVALSFNISRNHIQMTYYTYFALSIMGLFFLIESVKENRIPEFSKFAATMIIGSILGILSNLGLLWPNYEYGQESTRGKTELTQKGHQEGLSPDYVFGLSLEKSEVGMLMFPNFYGGTQGKSFYADNTSETFQAFQGRARQEIAAKAQAQKITDVNGFLNQILSQYTRQYRGSQTMAGGPMYYGAVVCALFILALLLLTGALKWGIIAAFSFFVVLAWGQNFPLVSDLMYNYFPLYNKFRDTKMTLLVAQPLIVLTIGMGLMELINFKAEKYQNTLSAQLLLKLKQTISRQGFVILGLVIALGICMLTYLYLSMATLSAPSDAELGMVSPSLVAALELDRAALAKADILKAIGFIVAAFGVLYLYTKNVINVPILAAGLAAITCIDLNMVNSEYVNETSYVDMNFMEAKKQVVPQKSDRDILKDQSIYHVVDYSRGYPSQNAEACHFHKSMGGYFAAKPLLYQEFWQRYQLDNGNVALKQHSNLMNMLNVKYIILSPERFMDNPTALGNAWFVQNINVVKNADEELAALDDLNPVLDAVVQEKYSAYTNGLSSDYSAGDKIYLERYHPDTMTYKSETSKDRFAVFSEMYYKPSKGWNVYIDGEKVDPFVKTNYVLRGLKVPAGKHEIKMIFEPISHTVGKTVSFVVSILLIVLLFASIYKHYKEV